MANTFWKSLGFSKLKNMSFGLFAGIFLLWTIFNASSFVPEGLELKYTLVFLGYGVLGVYIFGRQDLQTKLSKISLLGALPYFLIMTVVSFFLISFLLGVVDPFPLALVTALAGVPLYLQLSNALIFAVVETSFWQGHLDEKIGIFGSMIIAGFFTCFYGVEVCWLTSLELLYYSVFFQQ